MKSPTTQTDTLVFYEMKHTSLFIVKFSAVTSHCNAWKTCVHLNESILNHNYDNCVCLSKYIWMLNIKDYTSENETRWTNGPKCTEAIGNMIVVKFRW